MIKPRIFIGDIKAINNTLDSAIDKSEVLNDIALTPTGLSGDKQAHTKYHGGEDRALCHYPSEHYAYWKSRYPKLSDHFKPSAFGENLSTVELNEENVFIGDIYRWGETIIQVTQPRSPCFILNARFGIDDFSLQMQQSGLCGWLYRVLVPGFVNPDSPLILVERTSDVSLQEAIYITFQAPFDAALTERLAFANGLALSMQQKMVKRLVTGEIEDFSPRLAKNTL